MNNEKFIKESSRPDSGSVVVIKPKLEIKFEEISIIANHYAACQFLCYSAHRNGFHDGALWALVKARVKIN